MLQFLHLRRTRHVPDCRLRVCAQQEKCFGRVVITRSAILPFLVVRIPRPEGRYCGRTEKHMSARRREGFPNGKPTLAPCGGTDPKEPRLFLEMKSLRLVEGVPEAFPPGLSPANLGLPMPPDRHGEVLTARCPRPGVTAVDFQPRPNRTWLVQEPPRSKVAPFRVHEFCEVLTGG